MRAAALAVLLSAALAAPAQAGPPLAFDLCRERVEAVRFVPAEDEVSVHVRLTESAARELARETNAGRPVDIGAGREWFARFVVRDALRDRPPRTIRSTLRPPKLARALEAALQRPCAPVESR
ncbi:hypothetical protein GM160_08450 [Guyparkeria halophila]|uniref:Uncharacterized protein n=1 Tax=Guyparkeria halophila TaxID=47960 RepID=A0A6I6D644_9GAMM|nr:hypothetical protein [Guyparkeria halophila]QGT78921.1 hypothetical protein GM160_08450 [Guyparkeria halophila]